MSLGVLSPERSIPGVFGSEVASSLSIASTYVLPRVSELVYRKLGTMIEAAGWQASTAGVRPFGHSVFSTLHSEFFSGCEGCRRAGGGGPVGLSRRFGRNRESVFPARGGSRSGIRAENLNRTSKRVDPWKEIERESVFKAVNKGAANTGCASCQSGLGWSTFRSERVEPSTIAATSARTNADLFQQDLGMSGETSPSIVGDLIEFLNASWTPFHATAEAKKLLLEAGFQCIREEDEWKLLPGGRYFFTRNMSFIFAFAVGSKYEPGKGFNVVAAHTDSPCLKLKPVSASTKSGFLNVGVQPYGGGLWHTWFDRDLSVAGRVLLHRRGEYGVLHKLVKVERPILRIPTLAIHLDRTVNTDGFKPNLESHVAPILATQIKSELSSHGEGNDAVRDAGNKAHHPILLQILSEQLDCAPEDIADFELNVCDTQPSIVGGARNEFIFSGRLDNLASSYSSLRALVDSSKNATDLAEETAIRAVALFDNEEVGSESAQGAGSPAMFDAMKRITGCLTQGVISEGIVERTLRRSFLVSADMAHALHPNYSERHEDHHQPKLHQGLVIKHNANQRYATNAVTAFLFKEVAKVAGIPTQNFVVRNDMGCGSTIGPILAAGTGIRTVDCGMPQLSMHSIREMCGTQDVDISYRHFKAFYQIFSSIDESLTIDG